jgi:putative ABC transport system ATP-binding protein
LILGNSGSGKTTLLHLLGGLLSPEKGHIEIERVDIATLKEKEINLYRARNIGFIFQKPHLIRALSVGENMYLSQYLAGLSQNKSRVDHVLSSLGIADKFFSKVYELSEGQAQRVSIARALLNNPKLILADEPTSALDDDNCDNVIQLLVQLAKEFNTCLVIATHDQRLKSVINHQISI